MSALAIVVVLAIAVPFGAVFGFALCRLAKIREDSLQLPATDHTAVDFETDLPHSPDTN